MTARDCLLDWCNGNPRTHELSGNRPHEWMHTSTEDDLAPGYTGTLTYFSENDQACYYVHGDEGHELTAEETYALADQLERAAVTVRARAAQLASFNERLAS